MKLQTKVGLILASVWICVSIVIYAESKIVLARNYIQLENEAMLHDMRNTSKAYDIIKFNLELYTLAWAQWDEAYNFMVKKSQTFIDSNFVPGTFTSSQINFFLFYDTKGQFYYGKAYNFATSQMIDPAPEVLNYIATKKDFITHSTITSRKVGILNTPKGLVLMASLPIVTGDGKGPIHGSLLMGYYLNASHFKKLADLVGMELKFIPLPLTTLDTFAQQAYKNLLTENKSYYLIPINNKLSYGFMFIKDIDNVPVGMFQITLPRILYEESTLITNHYIFILITLGIFVIALMWYLLKIFVLNRIISVSEQITAINTHDDFNTKLFIKGSDELQNMVISINYMMELISQSQQKLNHMAHYDTLTSLPNRAYFYRLLSKAILEAKENDTLIGVMFIDIDNFKSVNDKYGHEIGDKFLENVAQRLKDSVRKMDVVGRQSGDEFILFLKNLTDMESIHGIAKNILQKTTMPIEFHNISISLSLSIGISVFPNDGDSIETLIKHADDAMYYVKKSTGNDYCFYSKIAPAISK